MRPRETILAFLERRPTSALVGELRRITGRSLATMKNVLANGEPIVAVHRTAKDRDAQFAVLDQVILACEEEKAAVRLVLTDADDPLGEYAEPYSREDLERDRAKPEETQPKAESAEATPAAPVEDSPAITALRERCVRWVPEALDRAFHACKVLAGPTSEGRVEIPGSFGDDFAVALEDHLLAWASLLRHGFFPFAMIDHTEPVCLTPDNTVVYFDHDYVSGIRDERFHDRDTLFGMGRLLAPTIEALLAMVGPVAGYAGAGDKEEDADTAPEKALKELEAVLKHRGATAHLLMELRRTALVSESEADAWLHARLMEETGTPDWITDPSLRSLWETAPRRAPPDVVACVTEGLACMRLAAGTLRLEDAFELVPSRELARLPIVDPLRARATTAPMDAERENDTAAAVVLLGRYRALGEALLAVLAPAT